jgi:hypothetical protein
VSCALSAGVGLGVAHELTEAEVGKDGSLASLPGPVEVDLDVLLVDALLDLRRGRERALVGVE